MKCVKQYLSAMPNKDEYKRTIQPFIDNEDYETAAMIRDEWESYNAIIAGFLKAVKECKSPRYYINDSNISISLRPPEDLLKPLPEDYPFE